MKRILSLLFLLTLTIHAQSNAEKTYYKVGGTNTDEIKALLKKDDYFKIAVAYLEDPTKMATVDINLKDPETLTAKDKIVKQKVPEYVKALEEFIKSVDTYNNPISAYMGLHLIKTVYGKNSKLSEFKKFVEVLYNREKNICTVYLDYAEIYEKGILTNKNLNKARTIYKEALALPKCNKNWYLNVLNAKLDSVERALN